MYYNENTIVYFNGQWIKATEAKTSIYDQSLHYGYAAFEGIRSYNTSNGVKIFKAREHFERMQFSCEAVGIPYPFNNDELISISYEVLQKNNFENAYLRPLVTATPNMSLTKAKGSQLFIAAWEWPTYFGDKLLSLKTSSYKRITPASFKVAAKISGHYINSILASQEAKDAGFDEALMLDINDFVAEGPGANIFIERNEVLYTPKTGSILPGITRATVLEICNKLGIEVIETQLKLEDVYAADSAFYCGTAAEVIGILSLDNLQFKKKWSETLGAIIQKAYKLLVTENEYQPTLSVA
jgi:branched-chain amino acid aminotransferase